MTLAVRNYSSGAEIVASYHAVRQRLMRPANAVKDTALPRRPHRFEVEEEHEHDDEPLPVEEKVSGSTRKSTAVMERIAAIQDVYFPGISASKIAELLGTSKNVVIGFYRRNPEELQSYPLVAHPGRKGKE